MSMTVTVDTSQFDSMQGLVNDAIGNIGEGLKQAIDTVVMPDLILLSQTLYNVRTGQYSNGWLSVQIDDASVMIDNLAIYAEILETGSYKMAGRNVLQQATEETQDEIAGQVEAWIAAQVGI